MSRTNLQQGKSESERLLDRNMDSSEDEEPRVQVAPKKQDSGLSYQTCMTRLLAVVALLLTLLLVAGGALLHHMQQVSPNVATLQAFWSREGPGTEVTTYNWVGVLHLFHGHHGTPPSRLYAWQHMVKQEVQGVLGNTEEELMEVVDKLLENPDASEVAKVVEAITSILEYTTGAKCYPAHEDPAPMKHQYATEGMEVTKIAFSSCYMPETMPEGNPFWSEVRKGRPDVWLWLGDNGYADGTDMNYKRTIYNKARNESSYVSDGPVKEGDKIAVQATWDDHDCCWNNAGNNFPCRKESQDEFVIHFNLPASDPIHKSHPGGQQAGVYNARMFLQPGTKKNGIHSIMLDARSGRDPTYTEHGACKGAASQMMTDVQWKWLEEKLNLESEITIIGSGVQVLPPTCQTKAASDFCSHDSHSGGGTTFQDAIEEVGEGPQWPGTSYESWGEMPKERARLLGLLQKALNEKKTKAVIFVTGDQHWAELMAKRMPQSEKFGASQVLYEVTASGIYQEFNYDVENGNRLRARSCDRKGEGPFNSACVFPFRYNGHTFASCTPPANETLKEKERRIRWGESNQPWSDRSLEPWCSTRTDSTGMDLEGCWGNCQAEDQELSQAVFSNSTNTCTESQFHICRARSNYGFIDVDFAARKVTMGIRTPDEQEEAHHTIDF